MAELEPALTPEYWQGIREAERYIRASAAERACADENWAEAIALANYLLPDDSEYKITRADADFLEWLAEQTRKINPISIEDEATLNRIANKLAALLPPENDDA